MELGNGIFAVKLWELEQEYGRLQSRLQLFQGRDLDQIEQECQRLKDEYREHDLLLSQVVQTCRSPAVAWLSGIQRDYGQQVEQILQNGLPKDLWTQNPSVESQAEAMALYAEFAIDFATQAMRHALISAFTALKLEKQAETPPEEKGDSDHE